MSSSVYAQLRDAIVDGRFEATRPLTETALAKHFGVSRTPIREALRRLEQDGLIERGARGMQVRARSPEEILEIYEVRILLEAAATRAAARHRTSLDLARLDQLHLEMEALDATDAPSATSLNRRFHEAIWTASHNATMADLLMRLGAHLVRFRETTLSYDGRWSEVLQEHKTMLEAIRGGDADAAERLAREHMEHARNTRLRMYAAAE